MRVRSTMVVAAVVAAAATSLSGARVASAQGSAPPPASASAPLGDRIFTPPTTLGEEWARALRAVLDGMKHLVDAERIEAEEVGGPVAVPSVTPLPPPPMPAWRTARLPASALREPVAGSSVQVTPVPIEPPTETPADARGQHAVLLGVKMELPWRVP
jgi:hypothetical protein